MHPDLLIQDEDWHIIVDLCKTVNLAMSRLLDACRVSEAMLKQATEEGKEDKSGHLKMARGQSVEVWRRSM